MQNAFGLIPLWLIDSRTAGWPESRSGAREFLCEILTSLRGANTSPLDINSIASFETDFLHKTLLLRSAICDGVSDYQMFFLEPTQFFAPFPTPHQCVRTRLVLFSCPSHTHTAQPPRNPQFLLCVQYDDNRWFRMSMPFAACGVT